MQDIGGKHENSDRKGEQPNGRTNKGKFGGAKGSQLRLPEQEEMEDPNKPKRRMKKEMGRKTK